jgi:hypothetical protein
MSIQELPLIISKFDTAIPAAGEAIGILYRTTWGKLVEELSHRREGEKDGRCFASATFETKPDRIHIGRKKHGALSRTAIVLDIEWNKKTGEIPPQPCEALRRAGRFGLAALVYTSHNHTDEKQPRYRVVIPLSDEISCQIPAPEIMAEELGLTGVLDRSKVGPASLFYLPSCPPGALAGHYFEAVGGAPVDADTITDTGISLLRARKLEEDRRALEAQAAAAERRAAKLAAGFDPDDSVIEKIRAHLDLESILLAHGYEQKGRNFRHPNSTSGMYGANIKNLGGIDRVFSHNSTDALHADNLPEWCKPVTALDAFDALTILNYGGDRKKALAKLAEEYGLAKTMENKALARLIFRLIRRQASQAEIEAAAMAEGQRLGLSRDEVCRVAVWVAGQPINSREAA